MEFSNRRPRFQIDVVHVDQPRAAGDELRIAVDSDQPKVTGASSSVDRWLPQLAPSPALSRWFAGDPDRWHEFCRRYGLELDHRENECEQLRQLAWQRPLALVYQHGDGHTNPAAAMKRHLQKLECRRRWQDGLMIGGYTSALRDEIERSGGLWFPRHKAWMMPDEAAWRHIHSLLPGAL